MAANFLFLGINKGSAKMENKTIRIKRTEKGIKPVIGQEVHIRDEEGLVFLVKVIGFDNEFVEVGKLEQVIQLANETISVIGGTLNINATETTIGHCQGSKQEVKQIHKIVNNVESVECEVDGKLYKACEDGCPIWKSNEGISETFDEAKEVEI